MARKNIRFCIHIFIMVVFLICTLSACGNICESITEDKIIECELWIATLHSGNVEIIQEVAERFKTKYPNVSIKIDVGPENAEEYDIYLDQIRTKIMAGEGPDLFMIPSEGVMSSVPITDINQFMRSGLCLDMTDYYDGDKELNKNSFSATVMDAGVIDGMRYVLPLRFNFPVIYTDVQQLEKHGLSLSDLQYGIYSLADAVQTIEPGSIASAYGDWFFNLYWMNCISDLANYDTNEILLKKDELVRFLNSYRALTTYGIEYSSVPDYAGYVTSNSFWAADGQYFFLGTLENLVQNIRIARAEGVELAAIPMATSDGSIIANVSYYGAIGANTKYPNIAYDFLRQFLLEENQWENNISEKSGLIEFGWPVLSEGSWSNLDEDFLEQHKGAQVSGDAKKRNTSIYAAQISEEDFAILYTQPTAVRFLPVTQWDYMVKIESKLNIKSNPDAMSVDVEALADEILQELTWEVAEG